MDPRKTFGDIQTPLRLAHRVGHWVLARRNDFDTVIEPTCGSGAFLAIAHETFGQARLLGFDLDSSHLARAAKLVPAATLQHANAFEVDWAALVGGVAGPVLLLGNPPWSTTAVQGRHNSRNRPRATEGPGGLAALTGASNFDVSEWLVRRWLEALRPGDALAMILKRSVIRRLLDWEHGPSVTTAQIAFDARRSFNAAVDAAVFFAEPGPRAHVEYASFDAAPVAGSWRFGTWVPEDESIDADRVGDVRPDTLWRSGLKHDCTGLFELHPAPGGRRSSALEESLDLEDAVCFPLLKSTDLARGRAPHLELLVTQRRLDDDPARLAMEAPRAWAYLERHREVAERRKSRIYRGRPAFAQFGVGPYSFACHKVAVSGLHWPPRFQAVGPVDGKPVFFDDTCYAWPTRDAASARALAKWLNHPTTRRSLEAFTDPMAKRPVTKRLLSRLRVPDSFLGPASGMGQIGGRDGRKTGTADPRGDRRHPASG